MLGVGFWDGNRGIQSVYTLRGRQWAGGGFWRDLGNFAVLFHHLYQIQQIFVG